MEKISISTIDGVNLSALWWDAKSDRSVLLLHMMPATKESWETLGEELLQRGLNVLAIDFRGHGESEGGDYKNFSDEDHAKYFLDARAGLNFLEDSTHSHNIVLAGASIGANIVLQCMSQDPNLLRGVCLSAGVEYHGVRAIDFAPELQASQSVLFVGSQDDGATSQDAEELAKSSKASKQVKIYEVGGHGTNLFKTHPELAERVVDFLTE